MDKQYLLKMCVFSLLFCVCFGAMIAFAYNMNAAQPPASESAGAENTASLPLGTGVQPVVDLPVAAGAAVTELKAAVEDGAAASEAASQVTAEAGDGAATPQTEAGAAVTQATAQDGTTAVESQDGSQEPVITPTAQPEDVIEGLTGAENTVYAGKVVVNVSNYLNIRKKPAPDAKMVGKLYNSSGADVIEVGDQWSKISSGNVTGWVNNDYIVTGQKAAELVASLSVKTATVKAEWLRVREKPDTTSTVIADVRCGETFIVAEESKKWVQIIFTSELYGFLSKDYVTVENTLGTAVSIKEEKELKRLAKQKAEATAEEIEKEKQKKAADRKLASDSVDSGQSKHDAPSSSPSKPAKSTRAETNVDYSEEYMLAALCQMEAGGYDYDACLAVANVVLNRKNKGYGSSIKSVIYAKGQFPGAGSGLLQKYLNSGPSKTAKEAASDALAGINNVGDYVNFCASNHADTSACSEYVIIGDNCFYKK